MDTIEISEDKAYSFGDFRLCTRARELFRAPNPDDDHTDGQDGLHSGSSIVLEPKVLDLLIYLIENRDRVVPKPELHQALWDMRPVSETVLSHCVMKARQALEDDGKRQTYIRTVRGHGYRFVAEATTEAPQSQSTGQTPGAPESWISRSAPNPIKRASRQPRLFYAAAVATVAAVFTLGLLTSQVAHSCLN